MDGVVGADDQDDGGLGEVVVDLVTGRTAGTGYRRTVAAIDAVGKAGTRSAAVTVTTVTGGGGGTDCPAARSSGRSYVPGDTVAHAGNEYTATCYSTGVVPNARAPGPSGATAAPAEGVPRRGAAARGEMVQGDRGVNLSASPDRAAFGRWEPGGG
ncbi:hypothetical protein GCM10010495_37810 [Kitasatospora herbaricolor]|nr:hypothetical protein GCM10010495_37810 [Kitasatospora herbaricolor]